MIAHGKPPCDRNHAPDAAASTASRPNVRDDGQRPSEDGMAGFVAVSLAIRKEEYFHRKGLTGK